MKIGRRLIDGLNEIKADMNSTQISLMKSLLEKSFKCHLDIHCNYLLKNQFIPQKTTLRRDLMSRVIIYYFILIYCYLRKYCLSYKLIVSPYYLSYNVSSRKYSEPGMTKVLVNNGQHIFTLSVDIRLSISLELD